MRDGAWLGGTVLGAVSMSIHHKLCHTLGGTFNLPHAETHTIVLPHATAYNAKAAPEAMQRIARALGAADGLAVALNDLLGRPLPFEYAASSHLGGMAAGWIAWRFLRARAPAPSDRPVPVPEAAAGAPTRTPAELRAEVDRVLDKINARGLGALSPDERRTLDEAKHLLNGR